MAPATQRRPRLTTRRVRKLRQQRAVGEDPLVWVAVAERLAQPLAQRLGQAAHAHVLVEDLVCRVHGVVEVGPEGVST